MIACVVNVGITQDQQRAHRWVYNQLQRRFENESAGAFRSHQRARDIESVFGKQIVEIVTGNPTRNFRVTLPNEFPILIAQSAQLVIYFSAPPASLDDLFEFQGAGFSDAQNGPVVQQHFELAHIVGTARATTMKFGHDGMHAAGIIAEHAADRAMVVGRRVRPKN